MKNVLKKINVFGLVALFVAGGMALAFTPKTIEPGEDEVTWGQTENGTWVELTTPIEEDAKCEASSQTCKAIYLKDANPNDDIDEGLIHRFEEQGYVDLP